MTKCGVHIEIDQSGGPLTAGTPGRASTASQGARPGRPCCPTCGRSYATDRFVGGLTKRQRDTLVFIAGYVEDRGYSPSFDEIKDAIGLASKGPTHRLIHCLIERGFITAPAARARSISVTDLGWSAVE